MRPLKSKIRRKRRKAYRDKYISKKNVLNIFQNKIFLIELSQLLFFGSTSIILVITFLNQAWTPISFEKTQITGLSGITINDLKKSISIFYPKNLLELNPKEIESYLRQKLPIKEVSVNREFFPPKIHINIIEREPIAFAIRLLSDKIERGMIDIKGSWIPLKFVNESKKNTIKLTIENWNPNKKNDILLIIKNKSILQSDLQRIKIDPLQEISIQTEYFNSVLLGTDTDRLIDQFNKLNQLEKSLPNLLINTKVKIVDLKDPSKPELKIEKILSKEK